MSIRRAWRLLGAAGLTLMLMTGSAISLAAVQPAAVPANDNFGHARTISSLPFTKTESVKSATTQPSEPLECSTSGNTVWFRYTPGSDTLLGVDTRGSNFTNVVTVYTGSSLATLDEDGCSYQINGNAADFVLPATGGTTYYFQVGVYANNHEGRSLQFNVVALTTPANDLSTHARNVGTLPYIGPVQDIRGATSDSEPGSTCSEPDYTIWYRFAATKTQTVRVDNLLGDFETSITVYRGSGLSQNSCTDLSSVSFRATKGTVYYIKVGGGYDEVGNVRLRLRAVTPPSNDNFAHPTSIGKLPRNLSGSTATATIQKGEPQDCENWIGSTVWYTLKPTATGNYRFESIGGDFNAQTAIYTGSSIGSLSPLGCGNSLVERLTKNHVYRVAVGGAYGENGAFKIHVSTGAAPANDNVAHAKSITIASPFAETASTTYATNEPGEADPSCTAVPYGSVWYSFTPAGNAVVRVQTIGSSFDTMVSAYSGPNPSSLTQVGCDDDSRLPEPEYLHASIAFHVASGTKYWVQAGGYSTYSGSLKIQIQKVTPPSNDAFANAIGLSDNYSAGNIDTTKATVQANEPSSNCNSNAPVNGATVWYKYQASSTSDLTFNASNSQFEPEITVFSGTDINALTQVDCNSSSVTWTPVSGTDYRIQVSGSNGGVGALGVSFDVAP